MLRKKYIQAEKTTRYSKIDQLFSHDEQTSIRTKMSTNNEKPACSVCIPAINQDLFLQQKQ
jgi:hypothetical protein